MASMNGPPSSVYIQLPVLAAIFAVCLATAYSLYVSNATPLRKIPGPFLARITKLWIVNITRQHRRHVHDISLHQHYGPVVRIAPKEVLFASPNAVRMIYGTCLSLLPR